MRGQRRGFNICTLDGEEGILASSSPGRGPKVGKYTVHVKEFEELALARIDMDQTPAELYIIDEIGRMELESTKFRTSIIELLARPSNLLGTVPKRGKGFLDQVKVRNDIEIIEVTKENRDELPGIITERIVNQMKLS